MNSLVTLCSQPRHHFGRSGGWFHRNIIWFALVKAIIRSHKKRSHKKRNHQLHHRYPLSSYNGFYHPIPASSLRESSVSADLSPVIQGWIQLDQFFMGKNPWENPMGSLPGTGWYWVSCCKSSLSCTFCALAFWSHKDGERVVLYPVMIKHGGKWSNLDEFRQILYKGKISKNNGPWQGEIIEIINQTRLRI